MNQNQDYRPSDDYAHLYGSSASKQTETIPQFTPPKSDYKNYYQSPVPVLQPPKPKKPKEPFSPISLLLVAGVIFLFLGGVIFLTNTWKSLSDITRAFSLLSASLIAFGANILSERIFRLKKTGLAFYILGCIFLPLALGGIGVFELFGNWFSFKGDGAAILWAVIFLSISGSTYLGQQNYKNTMLVWLSLAGLAGSWISMSNFMTSECLDMLSVSMQVSIFGMMIMIYAAGSAVLCEYYLRNHKASYITKAIPSYLYIVNTVSACFMLVISHSGGKLAACIFSLILAVLFCNYQFIEKKLHVGIFGSLFCIITALYQVIELFPKESENIAVFIITVCSVFFMSLLKMPKLRTEFTETYSKAGLCFSVLIIFYLSLNIALDNRNTILWLLYPLLGMGAFFYAKTEKNKLSKETVFHLAHSAMLFAVSEYAMLEESSLLMFGLVISALILLIEAILRRKIWLLSTAILTSGAVLLLNLKHAEINLLWLCAAGLLGGLIYANKTWRFLLERCCAWAFIAFFTTALQETLEIWTENNEAWIFTLCASGLLYLLETFVFWKDLRPNATKPYLEAESLLLSVIAFGSYQMDGDSKGFGFLLCLLLLIFSAGFLRKNINIIALPQLIMLFVTVHALLEDAEVLTAVLCYLALLIVYALMGRFLLPQGFFCRDNGKFQIDWALLAGILPVFGGAFSIDWYPSILVCLFLAVYSLLYIGRVENKFIPTLMASAFSCLTILFHNINDPFEIFLFLHDSEMKTPQVLLYAFPIHLFILSLLWILPERFKKSVHTMRFVMYCFTMFCLLCVSLNFKIASDAILLMVFSFAILTGSFSVKKLRWFTLGFSILFLTTIRLTWQFWTSLHWGIYLFLAGILLIGIASYTEYKNRYHAEHPDEPKKKMELFKTWTW